MATKKKKSSSRSATLRLDSAFYPKAALERAKEAFSKLARIEISRKGNQQVISFSGMSASAARKLPDEFANFALSCAVVDK